VKNARTGTTFKIRGILPVAHIRPGEGSQISGCQIRVLGRPFTKITRDGRLTISKHQGKDDSKIKRTDFKATTGIRRLAKGITVAVRL